MFTLEARSSSVVESEESNKQRQLLLRRGGTLCANRRNSLSLPHQLEDQR